MDYLLTTSSGCETPHSNLSDGSLDALLDSTIHIDQASMQHSPIRLQRTGLHHSTSDLNQSLNSQKRSFDHDDTNQNIRKYPRLLTQALRDDVKIECQDPMMNSSSSNFVSSRNGHQVS